MTAEAVANTRVVVLNGARQVGKSTLAQQIADQSPGSRAFFLDNQAVRSAAQADPAGFVRHDGLLLIDEIQRVPELLLSIKREVDRDPRAGRFLLTGSARLLDLRDLPDALSGRTETIELWPLSQGEISSAPDGFADAVFRVGGDVTVPSCSLRRPDQSMASDIGIARPTLSRYLDLLELVFVIRRIPAWSSTLTTRAIATPKLIMTDTGLGGRLIGFSLERAKDPTAPAGQLLENFVIGEIARQLTWCAEPVQLFHYRDRDKVEVDIVLEHAAGDVVAVEVKASETVRAEDFRGLRHLASRLGNRFKAGLVLYAGPEPLPFGDRMRALPIAALWAVRPDGRGD